MIPGSLLPDVRRKSSCDDLGTARMLPHTARRCKRADQGLFLREEKEKGHDLAAYPHKLIHTSGG